MLQMALIEIDGLPYLIAWFIFPWLHLGSTKGASISPQRYANDQSKDYCNQNVSHVKFILLVYSNDIT